MSPFIDTAFQEENHWLPVVNSSHGELTLVSRVVRQRRYVVAPDPSRV